MNGVALTVFVVLFLLVTVLCFVAARWRAADLGHLNEWGFGGRSLGTVITWFLLGGDLYTAYTFMAVPAPAPSSATCRCSSRSRSSPPTPTRAACARRR